MVRMSEHKMHQERYMRIFEDEFYPHADALYNFAYNLTYNENDASDLVQETYLKACKFIDKYLEGTNAKAWLFKILKNAFINQYRKKAKGPVRVDLEDVSGLNEGEDQSNLATHVDLRQEIYEKMIGDEVTVAVNRLPVDFRTVLLLCDIEGFTYEEISKILDIPIGTVRSRLHRARNLLKVTLSKYAKTKGYLRNQE